MRTGKGVFTVTRTEVHQEVVWVRDDEGAEHRIAYDDLPPGPYHQCGDCNCGEKEKKNGGDDARGGNGSGNGGPHDGGEPPPEGWDVTPPDAQ